jgi:hypothetical protein
MSLHRAISEKTMKIVIINIIECAPDTNAFRIIYFNSIITYYDYILYNSERLLTLDFLWI